MLVSQEENYLNPEQIESFINILPQVISTRKQFKAIDIQMMVRIQYSCALRISEVLTLTPNDFDLINLILTLNNTKTGFKKCKCSKFKNRKLISFDPKCSKCKGLGKIRKPQFTTIWNKDKDAIRSYLKDKPTHKPLFQITRLTAWRYYKKAGILLGLHIREQQEERAIEGIWTHLLRKCNAKLMERKGANETLIKLKLRHTFTVTERYTKPDIQYLKRWESENL